MIESQTNNAESTVVEPGIPIADNYKIDTYDKYNVCVKKRIFPKPTEEKPNPEPIWKVISFHPSIEYAFKSIVDERINLSVSCGIENVIDEIKELKEFKDKLQI